jgi:hypothetical protein
LQDLRQQEYVKTAMSSGDALVALINDVLGELALAALEEACSCQRGIYYHILAPFFDPWSQPRVKKGCKYVIVRVTL